MGYIMQPLTLTEADTLIFLKTLRESSDLFDVRGGVLPPKQYFLPPVETTFTVRTSDNTVKVPRPEKDFILFGLSLDDLEAIACLDSIMSTPDKDYYYFRRRERSLLIGLTETTFDFDAPPGGDIILSSSSKGSQIALAVTQKGEDALKRYLPRSVALKETHHHTKKRRSKEDLPMAKLRGLFMDTELLKDAVKWSWKSYPKLWKRLGRECLGCGICTYVCPLCHCFSMEDSIDLSGKCASKFRKWDACTLPGFAKISGGHDFHPTIKERYYNWFYHKFVRSYLEFGRAQCVGCGRCQSNCPARIDIEEILVDIVERYNKARH